MTTAVIKFGYEVEVEYYLKITRATNGKTIEELGLVPSIVIFNWLIPVLPRFPLVLRNFNNKSCSLQIRGYLIDLHAI